MVIMGIMHGPLALMKRRWLNGLRLFRALLRNDFGLWVHGWGRDYGSRVKPWGTDTSYFSGQG